MGSVILSTFTAEYKGELQGMFFLFRENNSCFYYFIVFFFEIPKQASPK